MFGLDQLFDFNGNGKLDAFERACEMTFLYNAEEASGKPDRGYGNHLFQKFYGILSCQHIIEWSYQYPG